MRLILNISDKLLNEFFGDQNDLVDVIGASVSECLSKDISQKVVYEHDDHSINMIHIRKL